MASIFSTKRGNGNAVILIHGFCETHEIWTDFSEALSSNFTAFTLDLPGFGKSDTLNSPFSISDIADTVLDWKKSNKIENPVIIGHSLGGYVALAMASKQPTLFSGLGLFHSTAEPDTEEKKENRNKVVDFVTKNGVQSYIDSFVPALFHQKKHPAVEFIHEIASATKKESIIEYAKAMRDRPGYLQTLKSLSMPTFFVAGEFDTFIAPQNLQLQSKSATNGYFLELANTAHMGMYENFEVAIKSITDFLKTCFHAKA